MDYNELIKSAENLKQVSEASAKEYDEKSDTLIAAINQKMLSRNDIEELVGVTNLEMMKDNHQNHVRFISSILYNFNAKVLVDTILWVFRAYRSRKFHSSYWAAQLNSWINVINTELSNESAKAIIPYYQWMQINIPAFTDLSDQKLEENSSKHLSN